MSKALYRKYRPTSLSEVVGQSQVTEPLAKSLENNKISHAYLFIGPRGTGKTSVARILAHKINGFSYKIEDNYVDIIEIDGASNRGIDNIRELREKALVAPTSGKYKIYIIDEVHMLTKEAFNALLKTLEEPPAHVVFIMATTDAYKVPTTITSRSQIYTFKLSDEKTITDHLKKIASQEKINITNEALSLIAKRGGGSFRDSLSLLDQISTLSKDQITEELIISALGLPNQQKILNLLTAYSSADVVKITTLVNDLLSTGIKPETITEELINHIVKNPQPELLALLAKLPEVKSPYAEAKLLVALVNESLVSVSNKTGTRNKLSETVSREPYEASEASSAHNRPPLGTRTTRRVDGPERARSKKVYSSTDFSWDDLLEKLKDKNDAIYLQLKKSNYELDGQELHIYPTTRVSNTILSAKNNLEVLKNLANGLKITVHQHTEKPKNAKKDQVLDKISDIMGGEVKNDGGENPFN